MGELELEPVQVGFGLHDSNHAGVLWAQVSDLNCGLPGSTVLFCNLFSIDFYEPSPGIKVAL